MAPTIKEGTVPFDVPAAGKPCETWYKIVGELSSPRTPLITIHGGPGMSHDYMIQLSELNELNGTPIVFYVSKLGLVEKGYDVLGHSWGGMVGSTWAGTNPKGLRKLILSNSPAYMTGWTDAYARYLEELQEPEKGIIKKAEEERRFDGEEFEKAMMVFMKKHSARVMPPEFFKSFDFAKEDDTVSDTM
jgi:pimeloyl-ACP methyl ester carboxylesterase